MHVELAKKQSDVIPDRRLHQAEPLRDQLMQDSLPPEGILIIGSDKSEDERGR